MDAPLSWCATNCHLQVCLMFNADVHLNLPVSVLVLLTLRNQLATANVFYFHDPYLERLRVALFKIDYYG